MSQPPGKAYGVQATFDLLAVACDDDKKVPFVPSCNLQRAVRRATGVTLPPEQIEQFVCEKTDGRVTELAFHELCSMSTSPPIAECKAGDIIQVKQVVLNDREYITKDEFRTLLLQGQQGPEAQLSTSEVDSIVRHVDHGGVVTAQALEDFLRGQQGPSVSPPVIPPPSSSPQQQGQASLSNSFAGRYQWAPPNSSFPSVPNDSISAISSTSGKNNSMAPLGDTVARKELVAPPAPVEQPPVAAVSARPTATPPTTSGIAEPTDKKRKEKQDGCCSVM